MKSKILSIGIVLVFLLAMPIVVEAKTYEAYLLIKGLEPRIVTDYYEGYPIDYTVYDDYSVGLYDLNIPRLDDVEDYSETDISSPFVFNAKIVDENGNILNSVNFYSVFLILSHPPTEIDTTIATLNLPYYENAKYLRVYKDDKLKLEVELKDNLCNNDNTCNNYENYYSCPNDCGMDSKDGACTSKYSDEICDPDCYYDSDCAQFCGNGIHDGNEQGIDCGGACEKVCDRDNDGIEDVLDNCPDIPNSDQKNTDLEMSIELASQQGAAQTTITGQAVTGVESNLLLYDNFDGTTKATTTTTTFVEGKYNKGILIDNADKADYNFNPNIQKGTIEYWIKPSWDANTDTQDRKLLFIGDLTNGIIVTGKNNAGKGASTYLEIFVNGEDKILPFVIGANGQNWKQNQWYHVAWSWDSTTGELKAYLNGNWVNSYKYKPFTVNINSNKLQFGYAWGNTINSVIDELKIYNVVRTAQEIKNDMLISTEPVPETKLQTEPVPLVEEPITTTKKMIGDFLGDACDEDDDNDNTLDENDLCEKTYPSANMILSVGCSCEQILVYKPSDNFIKELNKKEPGIYGRCEALIKGASGKGLTLEKATGKSVFENILGFVVRLFR